MQPEMFAHAVVVMRDRDIVLSIAAAKRREGAV